MVMRRAFGHGIRRLGRVGVPLLTTFGLVLLPGANASAADGVSITTYSATVTVNEDGSLHVGEAVTYDFAAAPGDGLERTLTTREHYDAEDDRVYDITDLSVEAVQSETTATMTSGADVNTIEVEFDDTQAGPVTVNYDYDVVGAVAQTADGLEVRWPVVQGFDEPIAKATVDWNAPGILWLSCLSGAAGSSRPCTTAQLMEVASPTMTQVELAAGDQMVGILGLSADSGVASNAELEPRWSISRSFTATGTPLWVALAVLLLGLFAAFVLWWTRGRDSGAEDAVASDPLVDLGDGRVVFSPPSAVRPGQMGTLVDEHADVVDVSSTLIDLAARNYLFIEEIERGAFGRMDWLLRRRNDAGDELLGYEREIFETVFSTGGEVLVSDLPGVLRERLPGVQALMYDDMVDQGWFAERPDAVRGRWTTAGWVLVAAGVVLTVVLALASTFGLVGLAFVLAGVALTGAGQLAPARTSRGSRVLHELRRFRDYLEAADVSEIPPEQREEIISRLYPYAVVFGVGDRWADALAAIDSDPDPDDPLYWYGAPSDWHLSDAAPSLSNLTATLNATIGSRRLLAD